jgi:hypothetical protein
MTQRDCRLQVDFEQKISRSSIGQGNDKCGSVRMDCFGLFTFDRRKKIAWERIDEWIAL